MAAGLDTEAVDIARSIVLDHIAQLLYSAAVSARSVSCRPMRRTYALRACSGSAAFVLAGQNRPDDPQDREDESNEAKDPMAFAEAENREDDQQNKVDDA
jgi:hypothetical protein